MKRITVEEVVEAFKITGLKPKPGNYLFSRDDSDNYDCACGLGALYKAGNPETPNNKIDSLVITHHFNNVLGTNYRLGFVHGFDGGPKRKDSELSLEYMAGYETGKASREALNITEVSR